MKTDMTQIKDYLRCPAQYAFKYIDCLTLPRTPALLQAHCVRAGADYNYRQKLTSYRDVTIRELEDVVDAEFERQERSTEWQAGDDRDKIKDETLALAGVYLRQLAPLVQPMFLDSDYAIELDACPGVVLTGRIKLVDENLIIREIKTSGRAPSAEEAIRNLTLTAHALAYRKLTGRIENGVGLDYLVSTRVPKLVSVMAEISATNIERLCAVIGGVAAAIEAGTVYPNPSHYLCSKKYCGYWNICHEQYRRAG